MKACCATFGRAARWARMSLAALATILAISACGPTASDHASTSPTQVALPVSAAPSPQSTQSVGAIGSPIPAAIRAAVLAAELPVPRSRAVAIVLGRDILVCGGLVAGGATTGSIVSLDTQASQITSSGALAAPVHDAGAASTSALALIFGGGNAAPSGVVQLVDGISGSTIVGHLPMPRADLSAVAIGDQLVVAGGGTPATRDRRVLTTTDGIHFQTVATLSIGVRYAAVVAVAGLVYVIGGSTPGGDEAAIQTVDPRSGVVRVIGQLPHGLSHASALELGGQLLILGGRTAGQLQDELWRLDPATGAVVALDPLPYAVSDAASAVVDGVGYLFGGEGSGGLLSSIISLTEAV
ncbi:MAG: hypothetical protein ABI578_00280 [Chloroflexota bacterium]